MFGQCFSLEVISFWVSKSSFMEGYLLSIQSTAKSKHEKEICIWCWSLESESSATKDSAVCCREESIHFRHMLLLCSNYERWDGGAASSWALAPLGSVLLIEHQLKAVQDNATQILLNVVVQFQLIQASKLFLDIATSVSLFIFLKSKFRWWLMSLFSILKPLTACRSSDLTCEDFAQKIMLDCWKKHR